MPEVVVIGSGYGGSILAARLAEAGLSVVILERGPRMGLSDLRQSDDLKYLQKTIELVVSSDNIGFRTGTMVGGASVPMDGGSFRVPQRSFDATDAQGRRYWPESYNRASMDPYYATAEEMLQVRQFGWDEIPKAGGLFAKMLDMVGASCERARFNYTDCLQCGFCAQGCIYDKKTTKLRTYLPLAEANGAEVRAGAYVDHIEPAESGYAVHYVQDGAAKEIHGDRVIVAGGGIHSPALLLRSANHLPGLSEQVGKNFNNNGEHGFIGILPEGFFGTDDYSCYMGSDNSGMLCFHWFDEEGFTLHPGGGIEPSIFAAALAAKDHPSLPSKAWGLEYKRFVESVYPHRVIAFSSLGLDPGHRSVILKKDGSVDVKDTGNRSATDAYLDRMESIVFDIGKQTDIALVPAVPRKLSGTTAAHLLSSCRMAERIEDGVVGPDGQVFGYENLYVCDASALPFALGVNPSLTISAMTERVAEGIVTNG